MRRLSLIAASVAAMQTIGAQVFCVTDKFDFANSNKCYTLVNQNRLGK